MVDYQKETQVSKTLERSEYTVIFNHETPNEVFYRIKFDPLYGIFMKSLADEIIADDEYNLILELNKKKITLKCYQDELKKNSERIVTVNKIIDELTTELS
jgi:hypothetical protein